jgi:endogenous inhibitor of DNA gyrase (YacG/DUF329 family)
MTGSGVTFCPICGRKTVAEFRPFCSRRCADVDLGRWLTGSYRIPAVEEDEDHDEGDDGPDPAQRPH